MANTDNKPKYSVGQRVIIRPDLEADEEYGVDFASNDMTQYKGRTMTIERAWLHEHTDSTSGKYHLEEDPVKWYWTDDMFTDEAEQLFKKLRKEVERSSEV